ncbi:type I polyketide synthase [Mycolicibacterium mengxianglii]|uniref:type I polyketide synthase n=1 Tax=Mycolicibacterium mengxianglii TaxID=2736649 RepID=UPI0018D0BFE6|nr:type I polyketide synthase [Mycolicibacterium mengxianglii]
MSAAPLDRRAVVAEALKKIDDLSARLEIAEQGDVEPIAVVGMGCRFPGGVDSPGQYWQLLREGGSGIVRVPAQRWDADAFYSPDPSVAGTICTREGGFLTSWQPDEFDAEFFGMSPREAAGMDPQQRLLLEVAWEALENAGVTAEGIRGSQTAVFVGLTTSDYSYLAFSQQLRPEDVDPYIAFGNASNFAAGRLSYFLGVHGPAVVVDTACSSSLVAVHLACQSLRRRESDQALAAGVNLNLTPENTIACSRWGMLAPDGQCKTFDADADGYVRSEGCGVVVLKRLSDAVRDGDSVLAVVRGSAVNQDGPSSGQTVPSGPAQQAVVRAALAASRLGPADIDFVEAHGTGTALGDPIELDALSQVFGERGGAAPLVLGSVKTNVGHLESAAGIAGFIKTVLSVRHGVIPRHLHFKRLTPHAGVEASRFTIAAQEMVWPAVGRVRRAGVSSFGVSGTNAHVVVEQAPVVEPVLGEPVGEPVVSTLLVSGKSSARVASTAAMLAQWMVGEGAQVPLVDVAHTLNYHRSRYKSVAAVCARDRAQAVAGLEALAGGLAAPGVVGAHEVSAGSGTVFVYSGQGSQWAGMGQRLLVEEPAFAAAVAELEPVFVEQVGFSLQQVLEAGEQVVGIERIQPVLVGMQLALTALWRSYGVEPDAVIGHSMGEVAAAVVAGALSVADGLKVIATRSKLMARLAGQGAMALLELDAAAAEKLITDYSDITLAVYASPNQTVIAGPPAQVDAVIAVVDGQGRLARRIEVDVASHHPTIDPILAELRSALTDLAPGTPTIPLISTVDRADGVAPAFDADYWVDNLRRPVRFSQAVATAAAEHGTFVEISPHPLLTYAIDDTLGSSSSADDFLVTSALKRVEDETLFFRSQLAAVGVIGADTGQGRFADIPPSPWQQSSYWIEDRSTARRMPDFHPLLGAHVEMLSGCDHVWQADIGTEVMPWLTDHQIFGQAVVSAETFAEMALAAGCEALDLPAEAVQVKGLEVGQLLALDGRTQVTTQLSPGDDGVDRVEIHARSAGGEWRRHAVASVEVASPVYQLESGVSETPDSSETEIVLSDIRDHPGYRIHPAMLDAAMQNLIAAASAQSPDDAAVTPYLPVSVATTRVFANVGRRVRCRTELVGREDEHHSRLGRIILMDDARTVVAELAGVELRRMDPGSVSLSLEQKVFDTVWEESPSEEPKSAAADGLSATPAGSWLLLADDDVETTVLVEDFAARFGSASRRVIIEKLSDESAVLAAIASTAADPKLPAAGVVVFVGTRSFDGTDTDGASERAQHLIWAISGAARAAYAHLRNAPPRLWLITRNGLAVNGGEPGDPAVGALKGLIRNWRFPGEAARFLAEEPDVGATLVDLDDAADPVTTFLSDLESPAKDDVIAWRAGRRYAERLRRATPEPAGHSAVVRGDGSYIVTGGLGGLGMVVARWLVARGAGRLVLNGRSTPSDAQRSDLAELAAGAEIVFVAGDIAAAGVAERLVAAAGETGLPLRGVVHAAGVTGTGIVAAVTKEDLERVWAPKVTGALRLHAATASRELDWWVGFSSMASLLGLPGQLAYTTANAWLDALVAWRHASGLPATAIGWGQWSDVGMSRALTYSVLDPITPVEGTEALESLVGGNLTRVGVGRMRLDRVIAANPEFRDLGYFERVVEELDATADDRPTDDDPDGLVVPIQDWSQVPAEDRARELTRRVQAILAQELRMPTSAVDVDRPFPELGLDSMMAMAVLKEMQKMAGIDLSASMLWNHPTISLLSAYLAEMLAPQQVVAQARYESEDDLTLDSAGSVLDELFDSVESASAASESGSF